MRVFLLLLLILGTGCMKASDLASEVNYYLADAGVLDYQQIERSANRRIQGDALIYIVQSYYPPVAYMDAPKNVLAEETFNAFVEYFPHMRRSAVPLGLDEAFQAARKERADFLLYTRFAQADARKLAPNSVIQLMLYDVGTGTMVDYAHIRRRGGLVTSSNKKPEDLLRQPMREYAQRLTGVRL